MLSLFAFALDRKKIPWMFLAVAAFALVIQVNTSWRGVFICDKAAIMSGEWWRIWTGHCVHFGWSHFLADAGLFLILGRLLEREHPWVATLSLTLMPLVICLFVLFLDPSMHRYGGLSAINFGLLLFLAAKGWQRNWVDWFWPSVLVIYVAEIVLEVAHNHGHGGGMIAFDDPSIRIGTAAHIGGGVFGILAWLTCWLIQRKQLRNQ